MSEVCDGVAIEPTLQPWSGETFSYSSAIMDDNTRFDICAQGFWRSGSPRAFSDVRICNPTPRTYRNSCLEAVYQSQEQTKRRKYDVREVEMSSFTPLIFSIFGGMSKLTNVAYKHLADLISIKQREPYSQVIS